MFREAKSSFCHLQNWNRNCRIATQLTKDRTKHVKSSKFYNLFDVLKLTTFQSNRNYLEELWRAFWFFKSTWGRHFKRGSTLCLPNEQNNIFKQFPRGQEKNLYLKMIDTLQKHSTFWEHFWLSNSKISYFYGQNQNYWEKTWEILIDQVALYIVDHIACVVCCAKSNHCFVTFKTGTGTAE